MITLESHPWKEPDRWREALLAVDRALAFHDSRMDGVKGIANEIHHRILSLSPQLDRLCKASCPVCPSPCCRVATVWYDLRDLIYLKAAGLQAVSCQIRKEAGGACCRLGPAGCTLPRERRPFICTWYLCPAHTSLMSTGISAGVKDAIASIREARVRLEDVFISVVSGQW